MEVNPLSIILVKSDSKGDRLLFRYPFHVQENNEPANKRRKNPFALPNVEDILHSPPQAISNINKGHITGFTDEVLSSLFAVKSELCNRKFELKVNDVRFVSHPTHIQLRNRHQDESGFMLINVVFALQALASHSVVKCYHDLSMRMGKALNHEEQRCGFVSEQTQTMMTAHDDGYANNSEPALQTILEKCTLAHNIKKMYDDLYSSGIVYIRINKYISLSFCLPQKVHQWHLRGKIVEPEDINRCLMSLKPYHSLLFLYTVQEISEFTSIDGYSSLVKLLKQYSALKNLQTLAHDADLKLTEVFELTAQLVYWAKATVIFPVCSTNKYVIASDAPIHLTSPLQETFSKAFPGKNLIKVITDFSLPTSLGQKCNPLLHPSEQSLLVQMIVWMLQHHLLLQIHIYIQYLPTDKGIKKKIRENSTKNSSLPTIKCGSLVTDLDNTRTDSEAGFTSIDTIDTKNDNEITTNRNVNLDNISFTSSEEEKQEEELLLDFPDEERINIFKVPASNNHEDLALFAKLCRKGYFQGNHHIEDIMYLENLRRSQLLQLLDKFRDILITYESEDPAIAMFSCT